MNRTTNVLRRREATRLRQARYAKAWWTARVSPIDTEVLSVSGEERIAVATAVLLKTGERITRRSSSEATARRILWQVIQRRLGLA